MAVLMWKLLLQAVTLSELLGVVRSVVVYAVHAATLLFKTQIGDVVLYGNCTVDNCKSAVMGNVLSTTAGLIGFRKCRSHLHVLKKPPGISRNTVGVVWSS